METDNLETTRKYYEGWETSDKSLLKIAADLKFSSPDGNFSGSKEFLDKCWQFSGSKLHNKIFLSGGDNVCVKYDYQMPDNCLYPIIEWLTFKDGIITEIQVYNEKARNKFIERKGLK